MTDVSDNRLDVIDPRGRRIAQAREQAEGIRLSLADQECFAQALLSLPKPAPSLERAFAMRNKLLRTE